MATGTYDFRFRRSRIPYASMRKAGEALGHVLTGALLGALGATQHSAPVNKPCRLGESTSLVASCS